MVNFTTGAVTGIEIEDIIVKEVLCALLFAALVTGCAGMSASQGDSTAKPAVRHESQK